MASPLAWAASRYQSARQLRQKPAAIIRSMFCTSLRASRCASRRRNTAASRASFIWRGRLGFGDNRGRRANPARRAILRPRPGRRIAPGSSMAARILDGKRIADALLDDLAARVEARVAAGKPRPGLAVVLVGED